MIVKKVEKTHFFVWKSRIFPYNPRMPKFKTKKISPTREIAPVSAKKPEKENIGTKKKIRIFVGILLMISTIAFWVTYAFQMVGSIKLSTDTGASLFQPLSSIFGESGDLIQTTKVKGTTNILIAGIGGKGHEGAELTDSLMLASINADDGYVTLLSIPRDLFVAYPKGIWNSAGRINTLYGIGKGQGNGVNLLASKVAEITWQSIDHYLIIDFSGFKQIVDTLWGVDIEVPADLVDYQYPNDNWGYTTFIVRQWLQIFDGDTALKYARSRHSTSDFDRSERQQLLIKAIKSKALSAGFITSPGKMSDLFNAVINNLDTDLTIWDVTSFAMWLKDIDSSHINIYNLSNDCIGYRCAAWAYLYNPSREYFGGASALIPENATASRLSYYDDIRRFVSFIFAFPNMKNEKLPLNLIYKKWSIAKAHELAMALQKVGFAFDVNNSFSESTGSITTSHVNIYWNAEANAWFPSDHLFVRSLKEIEDRIPFIMVDHNEYIKTRGPRIEIVLGDDSSSYFNFAKSAYYLPYIESTNSGINMSETGTIVSWEASHIIKANSGKPGLQAPSQTPSPYLVAPGEWENF